MHFGQITLTVRKMAAIQNISDELIDDSVIDVIDLVLDLFTEALGLEENKVILTGNGTTQPTGLTTARTAGTIRSLGAAAGITLPEMINTIYFLASKYRSGAKWYVHNELIRDLRNLVDGNNRHFWADPVTQGLPPTFYGYEVVEANDLPANLLFFGDLKRAYWLGDRQQMTVKITQETETALNSKRSINRMNCWETLSKIRTISSQVWTAMSLKVQRIANESLWDSNFATSVLQPVVG